MKDEEPDVSVSSIVSGSVGKTDSPVSRTVVSVSTVAWKRRSGFGKLSGSVGIGSSWERRRMVLIGTKLAYYSATESELTESQRRHPRGTLDILVERITVSPAIHSDDMPTPYGLYLRAKAQSLGGEDTTKWKLCFDTRHQQAAFLLALSDVVVTRAVTDFNKSVLTTGSAVAHDGFHRLYEEGGKGIFALVREILLRENKVEQDMPGVPEEGNEVPQDTQDAHDETSGDVSSPESTQRESDTADTRAPGILDERQVRGKIGENNEPRGLQTANDQGKDGESFLPVNNIRAVFGLVNVIVLYAFWVARVSSAPILSWWQVLLVTNFGLWILLKKPLPKSEPLQKDSTSTTQGRAGASGISEHDRGMDPTVSAVGAELLREQSVPLSEVPQEKVTTKSDGEAGQDDSTETLEPRVEQRSLTEEEMDFHSHERWALSDPKVDLSGSWVLIADDAFKAEYDTYLKNLGFNRITRGVAVSLISRTTEVTKQSERGRNLFLCGKNPKGAWERTIVASGYPDFETQSGRTAGEDYVHRSHSIKTAESEDVQAEAWWEDRGKKHISWLRGGTKYGGGDFESRRFLREGGSDGDVLVCESVFHPKKDGKGKAEVTWRFKRVEIEE